jgi:phosphate transport system substrate-binding protein
MNANPRTGKMLEAGAYVALMACLLQIGCKPDNDAEVSSQAPGNRGKITIQIRGSDTMVNLAQSWAEEYCKVVPEVSVEVAGGGTGVGLTSLIRGAIDIATASRNIKSIEIGQAQRNTGKQPAEFVVGYDALAIYVNKDNPLDEITEEQLAGIYAEGGPLRKWSQIGVKLPGLGGDEIIPVSRQSSSGTYELFRERVLKNKDFKLGTRDMNGSKEVVDLVASTPSAIGYSGMAYAISAVKVLKVRAKPNERAYAPTAENTLNKTYPLARSLLLYTLGTPEGALKEFIGWVRSETGQRIVLQTGFVPLPSMATQSSDSMQRAGPQADAFPATKL